MPRKPKYKLRIPSEDTAAIGRRIAAVRRAKGLTQTELCEKIGITQSLLSYYETGKLRLSAEMVRHFVIALGISADKILGLKNSLDSNKTPDHKFMRRLKKIGELTTSDQKKILQNIDLVLQGMRKP